MNVPKSLILPRSSSLWLASGKSDGPADKTPELAPAALITSFWNDTRAPANTDNFNLATPSTDWSLGTVSPNNPLIFFRKSNKANLGVLPH
jgi:hypothetical protein